MPDAFPEKPLSVSVPRLSASRESGVDHVPAIKMTRYGKTYGCCAPSSQERAIEPDADVPMLSEFNRETPLSDVLRRYIAVNSRINKVRTRDSYVSLLNNLAGFLEREATVADLTDETAKAFWVWREQGVSRNTVNGEATTLLAFWRWCARKRLCDDPDVTPPPKQKRRPKALTVNQMRQLFAAAISSPGNIGMVPANVFWPALLHVFWQTGERIGAVKQLKWDRIDLEGGWIEYPPDTRKFGQEELIRPINADAIAALRLLREKSPIDPFAEVRRSGFYNQFATLKSAARLPEWVTPHTIRKSVASALPTLEDAREMLGHSNAAITARNYRDDRTRDDRVLLDKLPSLTEPAKAKGIFSRIFG
jgi:integrase